MAEKRRFLDVWIVESNTVYREVPFTVVADWVQQGRLLEDDMLRPSGTAEWFRVGGSPDFAPYLPRAEPFRVEDQAEALEPVQVDFAWKRPHGDEDDDVDMIPLIDVSLVLLIFFMMTAAGAGIAATIPTPPAEFAPIVHRPEGVWININLEGDGGNRVPVYSIGQGETPSPDPQDRDIHSRKELLEPLSAFLKDKGKVELTINAHKEVQSGLVRQLTVDLETGPLREKIAQKFIGTSER